MIKKLETWGRNLFFGKLQYYKSNRNRQRQGIFLTNKGQRGRKVARNKINRNQGN